MCYVFASTDPALFEKTTRSLRISGVVTSICLEAKFWDILDEIAASQGMSTPLFLSTLYDEVVELRGEVGNFTSLLRVICTTHMSNMAPAPGVAKPMAAE
ncbi:ribbon-helix-helix domain-containing protein [Aestuariispira ectoiniformans]|uniref:ribbon-helix-helix domain-containing protein n=1 Tax=Aestuariispira ectoiniformans TaxID=2775080 RepID=UPI00223BA3E6|nr:ribbon-helix-helix domain-containing protein [Aestuariispira ectoiniformans]